MASEVKRVPVRFSDLDFYTEIQTHLRVQAIDDKEESFNDFALRALKTQMEVDEGGAGQFLHEGLKLFLESTIDSRLSTGLNRMNKLLFDIAMNQEVLVVVLQQYTTLTATEIEMIRQKVMKRLKEQKSIVSYRDLVSSDVI